MYTFHSALHCQVRASLCFRVVLFYVHESAIDSPLVGEPPEIGAISSIFCIGSSQQQGGMPIPILFGCNMKLVIFFSTKFVSESQTVHHITIETVNLPNSDCTALYCTVLHCTVVHCTALHCTVLYCTMLPMSHSSQGPKVSTLVMSCLLWRSFLDSSLRH